MGKSKNKKPISKQNNSESLSTQFKQKVKSFFSQPLNALLFKFSILMGLFYFIWATKFFQENFVKYVSQAYAKATGTLLNLLQIPMFIAGDSVGDHKFMLSIKNGCDGIESMAILLFAILVYPTSWSNRLKGFLVGLICLIVLNFVRITSLYMIGAYIPSLFDLMHVNVWQVIFIIIPVVYVFKWINWTKKYQLVEV